MGLKSALIAFGQKLSQGARPEDDEVIVERASTVVDLLHTGEQIVWEGAPSPAHAWADRDQLGLPGSSGTQPESLITSPSLQHFTSPRFPLKNKS